MSGLKRYGCVGLVVLCLLLGQSRPRTTPVVGAGAGGDLTRIAFASRDELTFLAQQLDVWEVIDTSSDRAMRDQDTVGSVVAWVTPSEVAWLSEHGFSVARITSPAVQLATIPDAPCYRTIEELYAQLDLWADTYPALTRLVTIGHSYEGRPLLMLQLTRQEPGPQQTIELLERPVLALIANIHGRELITPEVAMAFVDYLLKGYGREPDATWLLDHHRIEVLVSANPDGHVRNEDGAPWAYWRKNANPSYGICYGTDFGVDLNRNSSFAWGAAGTHPCMETYQGPWAVSETETEAIESLAREMFPDRRAADEGAAAPEDVSGLFISLHSYGNLILWPWGHTYAQAPNAVELARLGERFAAANGYVAKQASQLYPASGTTDDFVYGELGVPAYTFEIGSSVDGFYPACERYEDLVRPNLDALLYAAKVARAPYQVPAGPDALHVVARGMSLDARLALTITAQIDAGLVGTDVVIADAEVYYDVPPWEGGQPTPLLPVDGVFDSAVEYVAGTVTVTLAPVTAASSDDQGVTSRPLVFVRGRDGDGAWGPVSAAFVDLTATTVLYFPYVIRSPEELSP